MALDFGPALGTDNLNIGSLGGASLTTSTVVFWCRLTSFDNGAAFYGRNLGVSPFDRYDLKMLDLSALRIRWTTSTTALVYSSSASVITTGVWQFVAVVVDSAAGAGLKVRCYVGDLDTAATEITWASTSDGGTLDDLTAVDFLWGTSLATNESMNGAIARGAVYSTVLSLAEILALQFGGLSAWAAPGPLALHELGFWAGTGTQADLSGTGNNGTVSGATLADHAPIRILRPSDDAIDATVASRTARVSGIEFEVPAWNRKPQLTGFEFEVPNAPRTARLAGFELETPNANRAAVLTGFEFEVPNAPRTARIAGIEFEVPDDPRRRARIAAIEFEVPPQPRRARLSGIEFIPDWDALAARNPKRRYLWAPV